MKGRTCLACNKPLPKGATHTNRKVGKMVPYFGMADFAAKQMLEGFKNEEEIVEPIELPDGNCIILVNPWRAAALMATPKGAAALGRKISDAVRESVPPYDPEERFSIFGGFNDDMLKGEEDRYIDEYYGKVDDDEKEESSGEDTVE